MLDLGQLLPHCKRDSKLDTKTDRGVINEVADMKVCKSAKHKTLCMYFSTRHGFTHSYRRLCFVTLSHIVQGCSSVLFFEARKRKDLYVWLAKAPDGPSIKFHCANGETLQPLSHSLYV